jgi:hypothetical protein
VCPGSAASAPPLRILTAEESAAERARTDRDWPTLWQAIVRELEGEPVAEKPREPCSNEEVET